MHFQTWWIWMALAAIFIVAEIFTAGFFIFWFGIGAAVAGVLAIIGLGAGWQWGSFVVVTGVLLAVSKKFADRFTKKQPPGIGADRFVGKVGIVLEEIDNEKDTGRVRMDKEEWRAESEGSEIIPPGTRVRVTRLDGVHLVVTSSKEGE